ncbi:acyl transferase/acyl hydrolase/lysophospholipase [Trichoderma velutinum]
MSNKLWILSMDGGGVRSYSSLLILEHLLEECWQGQDVGEVFQVAYGTSGGGLCSLMLGRLGISIANAISELCRVSTYVFTSNFTLLKRPWAYAGTLLGRISMGLLWWSRHSSRRLKEAIQNINGTSDGIQTHISPCQSYVVCSWKNHDKRVVGVHLKTFGVSPNCPVWQAGLATSSAPTFFDPVMMDYPTGPRLLQDGGLGRNNPIETFELFEAENFPDVAPSVRQCYVSIGTGRPTLEQSAPIRSYWRCSEYLKIWKYPQRLIQSTAFAQVIDLAVQVATDTEGSHEAFSRAIGRTNNVRYFRFNCNSVLPEVGLDDAGSLDRIKQLTEDYLRSPEFLQERKKLLDAISEG